jgi:hypothetical protein
MSEAPDSHGRQRRGWLWWLNLSLSVGGSVLAIVLFFISQESRRLVFLVHPTRTEIVRSAGLRDAPLRLLRSNGAEIRSDVYAVHFVFWNAGNKPILAADVLSPLRIVLEDTAATILDFRLLAVSRYVTQADLRVRSPRSIDVGFRVFEPDDGVRGQIIYAGAANVPVGLEGGVIGVKAIDRVLPTSFTAAARVGLYTGGIIIAFGVLLFLAHALGSRSILVTFRALKEKDFFSGMLMWFVAFFVIFSVVALIDGQGKAGIYASAVPASLRP